MLPRLHARWGLQPLGMVCIAGLLACCGGGTGTGTGFSSTPSSPPASQATKCDPAPCLIDQGGMALYVTGIRELKSINGVVSAGKHVVAIDVRWTYVGTGSSSPMPAQVNLIGSDKVVQVSQIESGSGFPDCKAYDTPGLAAGGSFGPKPICFVMDVAPDPPLLLRWQRSGVGGADQDLALK